MIFVRSPRTRWLWACAAALALGPGAFGQSPDQPPVLAAPAAPPAASPTVTGPPPIPAAAALITLEVPADAQIWVQGMPTRQTGTRRSFVSPALQAGTEYAYEILVRWTQGGHVVEQTLTLAVRAGDRPGVVMLAGTGTDLARAPTNGR